VLRKRTTAIEPTDTIRVGSVRTFLDALEKFQTGDKTSIFFRGHKSFTFKITPSIYRETSWINNEDIMCKELILRCPNDFSGNETTFQTLVKMQHYALPTRLLDLTANPLIALFFASEPADIPSESGEILIFHVATDEVKYFDSDTVSVLANISRRPREFTVPNRRTSIRQFNSTNEIKYLLHEIKHEKPYFQPIIRPEHLESVVCVKPKMDNPRIIRQDGAFFIFGINEIKTSPAAVPERYCASIGQKRVLIIAQEKKKIRDQLKSLGITKATIYPDIEKVSESIKESYTVK